nr:immunoglobulin heavy chain junction region [Macaca mulatta]
CARLMIGLDVW